MPMLECNRLNTINVFHRIWSWGGNEIVFRIHEEIGLGVQFDQDRLVAWFHDQCVDKSCNSWSKGVDVCMVRKPCHFNVICLDKIKDTYAAIGWFLQICLIYPLKLYKRHQLVVSGRDYKYWILLNEILQENVIQVSKIFLSLLKDQFN